MEHVITKKIDLNNGDYLITVKAPEIVPKFSPGNFAILITIPNGERIPMSIKEAVGDEITMYLKRLGKTSREVDTWKVGMKLHKVIGPMGKAPEMKNYGNVVFCSDLVCGHAENYAMCKELIKIEGNNVTSFQTFPDEASIYPEEELTTKVCHNFILTTKDGSRGKEGHYSKYLEEMMKEGKVDMVFAGGDMGALRDLSALTKKYNVPVMTTVRQIMVDGTGMCGSCRVFVDGEMQLACIDGPMFDGQKVDWDAAISRLGMFKAKEAESMECLNAKMRGVN